MKDICEIQKITKEEGKVRKNRSAGLLAFGLSACLAAGALLGCQRSGSGDGQDAGVQAETTNYHFSIDPAPVKEDREDGRTMPESGEEALPSAPEENDAQDRTAGTEKKGYTFADTEHVEFWFGSGAGGWYTVLTIDADGRFTGSYHDSDMGDRGEDYPGGICYWCNFNGRFSAPVPVDEYTWSVKLLDLAKEEEPGTEKIQDGILYISSDPYGVDGGEEFLIYLPGTPKERLPEEFISWMGALWPFENEKLTAYGLYNVNEQNGFSGAVPETGESAETDEAAGAGKIPEAGDTQKNGMASGQEGSYMDETLSEVRDSSEALYDYIQHTAVNQAEMNDAAMELYRLWDKELNRIWGLLKKKLDPQAMDTLTAEEREWIREKEAEAEKAAAEFEGGSLSGMSWNMRAAKLTEDRVYELAEYLK